MRLTWKLFDGVLSSALSCHPSFELTLLATVEALLMLALLFRRDEATPLAEELVEVLHPLRLALRSGCAFC